MKKILAILLAFTLVGSVLTGCGDKKTSGDDKVDNQTENTEYSYVFRDLPEPKYITPAEQFAGGDGTENNPYQISNAAELALLHEKMVSEYKNNKADYKKSHYILINNISVNDVTNFDNWENQGPEYSWMPIGYATTDFEGVFDGNGHTVSGLYINTNHGTPEKYETKGSYGLFDGINGTMKNVTVEKSYFSVSGNNCAVGTIAGGLGDEALVENCHSSAMIQGYDAICGGIVGSASGGVEMGMVDEGEERELRYSKISNCSFSGTITQVREDGMSDMGGIVGGSSGNIEACVNNGTINYAGDNVDSVGGIAGRMGEGTISNCKNAGTLHCETVEEAALAIAGGIVGKVFVSATGSEKYMSRGVTITNCENSGTVEGQKYVGGIAGQFTNDRNDYCSTISSCINNGVVVAKEHTGGIIGHMNCIGDNDKGESLLVENCENKADLSKGTVGGIISSFMSETGDVTIKGCTNSGVLTSDGQHCAGIVAYWIMNSKPEETHIVIDGCKNTGDINSSLNAGGIISFMDMPVCLEKGKDVSISVSNCSNSGKVTTSSTNGYIGGILANWGMENISTTISKCTNSGTLSVTAAADSMSADDAKIMTVSRIVGGIVGRIGSGLLLTTDSDDGNNKNIQAKNAVLKITDSSSTGQLDVVNINAENYKNWFGGIIGNACGEDGFSVLVEKCSYTNFERGLGNEDYSDVGTKK